MKLPKRRFVCIAGVVVTILGILTVLPLTLFSDWTTRAAFGEMLGGVSAIFAALAFVVIAVALLIQQAQIAAQAVETKRINDRDSLMAISQLIGVLERRRDSVADDAARERLETEIQALYMDVTAGLRAVRGEKASGG